MTQDAELKSCPFCGPKSCGVHIFKRVNIRQIPDTTFEAVCLECSASSASYETEKEASEEWNSRIPTLPPGWVAVPFEPSEKMIQAGQSSYEADREYGLIDEDLRDAYKAMLSAVKKNNVDTKTESR